MKRARYHPEARDELRGAVAYDDEDRASRGQDLEQVVARIVRRIQVLPRSAPRWRLVPGPFEIRRAKVKGHPYLVVYGVFTDQLVVLAIAHTSKQPGYWRTRILK
ncbi:MAG: type II toxin-antitoxin system RelE/ParE family toxin [Deltaproteobacteria bacterium]|nr:type II toxin-antitoxin system RelE/ParE family toxin [Deltaproteobacteria bacterium]